MKYILSLLFATAAITVSAQSKFPNDSLSHHVLYSQSIKLNPKIKSSDIYAASLGWFADSARFTHHNADAPGDIASGKINKRQVEANEQFDNHRPLEMQDPEGGKIQGMGIIRYYGPGSSASIKLLYIKYDIGIKILPGLVTISISNIRYYHYHPTSYKQIPIYGFGGGKPCEEVGTIEALIACENFHDEFNSLAAYCNKQMSLQLEDYRNLLKQKKYLYDPKAANTPPAKSASKSSAKPAAKPAAKKK